jgi:hypothetical protein
MALANGSYYQKKRTLATLAAATACGGAGRAVTTDLPLAYFPPQDDTAQYIGAVEAPDEASAIKKAIEEFQITEALEAVAARCVAAGLSPHTTQKVQNVHKTVYREVIIGFSAYPQRSSRWP